MVDVDFLSKGWGGEDSAQSLNQRVLPVRLKETGTGSSAGRRSSSIWVSRLCGGGGGALIPLVSSLPPPPSPQSDTPSPLSHTHFLHYTDKSAFFLFFFSWRSILPVSYSLKLLLTLVHEAQCNLLRKASYLPGLAERI